MGSFDGLFLCLSTILLIIIQYYALTTTAQPTYVYHFCYGANYTANSTYQATLNLLLPSLSSSNNTVIRNGYYNATAGGNPDTIFGSFQCRGDVTSQVCQECVDTAAQEITQKWCPNNTQAIVWYDECMLRYSNQSFFSIMQESPAVYLWNLNNITNPDQFNQILGGLMDDLVKEAVSDGSSNFATGEANFTTFRKIYGLVQCTSDISQSNCNRCLRGAITELPNCCDGKQGGRVIRPSCNFRYEIYPFVQSRVTPAPAPLVLPPPTQPSPNTPTTNSKGKNSSKTVIVIVVPAIITVLLSALTIWYFCTQRRKGTKQIDDSAEEFDEIQSAESLQFNFSTIRAATGNFSDANKLGEGGFGSVYKGALLDGQEIAVKRLSRNSCQGEEEFKNEVVLVAKLQHRNLVRLLGFCLDGEEKLLIYEFMPNASLDQFIFNSTKRTHLDWERRYKIIGGIARGLLYLHEDSRLRIIHRDLKASNILLDADMNPKISDFGMARLFVVDQTQANTNRIVGTYGYMAPEYAMHGQFSVKSDVFSFGVLVLEILSGQNNNHFYESEVGQDLLSHAWNHWKNGKALELLDPTLRESCSRSEMMRCIHIGLLCVQEDIADRPTMASIVLMLNSYSTTLPLSSPPAFFVHSRMEPTIYSRESGEPTIASDQSTSKSTTLSVDEASITDLYPR